MGPGQNQTILAPVEEAPIQARDVSHPQHQSPTTATKSADVMLVTVPKTPPTTPVASSTGPESPSKKSFVARVSPKLGKFARLFDKKNPSPPRMSYGQTMIQSARHLIDRIRSPSKAAAATTSPNASPQGGGQQCTPMVTTTAFESIPLLNAMDTPAELKATGPIDHAHLDAMFETISLAETSETAR